MTFDDQRQEYRLHNQLTVFIELCTDNSPEPTLVISHSLDISANGLRAICERDLPVGSILRSCIQTADAAQRFVLMTEVKWSQPWGEAGEFLLGLGLFESEATDIQAWKEFIAQQCSSEPSAE